jgi:Flp pilus assembly pilin Flp
VIVQKVRHLLRTEREGGATLVEYSLLVALVCVLLIGAVRALTDSAGDELDDRGQAIGHPTEPNGVVSSSSSSSVSTSSASTSSSSSSSSAYSGRVALVSCTGATSDKNECTFVLSPAPPAGATVEWSIDPKSGFTGDPPSVTFKNEGERTVQAKVNGTSVTPAQVVCEFLGSGSQKHLDCR